MKKIFNYLKERKCFVSNYEDLRKEIKVITNTPSDKVTEGTLKNAISLLHKCEESIKKMDELVRNMSTLERTVLHDKIIEVQFQKDCFEVRKNIIIAIEEVVKS